MRDFTLSIYSRLLEALKGKGYRSLRFGDLMEANSDYPAPWVILRHDVDRLPRNALLCAMEEAERGMIGSYFFRVVPGAWDVEVIRGIADLGHECGYHYEDMDLAKGDVDKAYRLFRRHLARLRDVVPVKTICMHGSPLSRWDNREIWKRHNYRADGIIGEPYFDLDFDEVFYITDTGRSWNAAAVSVRDKVSSGYSRELRSTAHMIEELGAGTFPEKIMINTHPQRWSSSHLPWVKEMVSQKVKNVVKRTLVAARARHVNAARDAVS